MLKEQLIQKLRFFYHLLTTEVAFVIILLKYFGRNNTKQNNKWSLLLTLNEYINNKKQNYSGVVIVGLKTV